MGNFPFNVITTRDGTRLRTAVFAAERPNGQTCVLLGGQTEFVEKYVEVIAELNARGFTVATFDWRGQGGSARALDNPLKAHIRDFSEYDDDLQSFLAQVVAPLSLSPPLILAHSMGSHNALRTLHDKPGMFRAAVLVAPMLAVATRGYPARVVRLLTSVYALTGKLNDFAWGMAERDPLLVDFARQLCTSDAARFERTLAALHAQPELRLAGPTWGWIDAAYRSMDRMRRPGFAECIQTPVLMFGAGKDRIVLTEATRRFAARLPRASYVEIAEAEHEILMEQDSIRAKFWEAFDGFVAQC